MVNTPSNPDCPCLTDCPPPAQTKLHIPPHLIQELSNLRPICFHVFMFIKAFFTSGSAGGGIKMHIYHECPDKMAVKVSKWI